MTARRFPLTLILCSAIATLSCSEEKIRTYRIAKDNAAEEPAAPEVAAAGALRWEALAGWQREAPGQFQTALYRLAPDTRVSVSSLPGDAGGESANVNRWRQQVGLAAVDDVGGESLAVEGSDIRAKWFELRGEEESILAAIVSLPGETWFFKLNAPTEEAESRRAEFTSFLTTIRAGIDTPAPPADHTPSPTKPRIALDVPDGWEKSEGSSMRVASFRIPATDGPDADVSVVPLAGDSGSTLENVNRWRAQLRLPALESENDPALGSRIDGSSGPLLITHMVSEEALFEGDRQGAISTAILKSGDFTWFFKLAGEAGQVRRNRDKFEAFVRSAKVP